MNAYSIGSDSPRWWWPSAAAGAVGSAAIAAILVLPANSSTPPGRTTPQDLPAPVSDPWFSTYDPVVGRQCFALPARWNATLALAHPRCGHSPAIRRPAGTGVRRPGLDTRP